MKGIVVDFDEKKITQKEFYSNGNKKIVKINDINVNEILISSEFFPGLNRNQHIIGCKHNHKIKPLYIKLPKYVCRGKTFKKNMTIPSEINNAYFFEKYNKIWKKIEELIGKSFERKPPFYNNITCTTKIKTLSPYSEDYQDIKIPRKEMIYKFSSIAILHSVNTKDSKYYPQAYTEEYEYERVEEVSYFDNYFDSDSDSDFDE